jgi:triphosphatase
MLERELKFHVPARQRAGVKAHLRKLKAEPIALHARYFDTPDQALARAQIALRLRLEGDVWVQTMKTPGPDELSRIEWNHPRPEPTLDLSVYEDTHVGPLIARLAPRLRCRYVTQVTRLKKVVPTESGSAELAYDEGRIMAGDIELPIHELEVEGVSGETGDLFALARDWLREHQLLLELRSKAARGDAIAALADEEGLDVRIAPGIDTPTGGKIMRRSSRLTAKQSQQLTAAARAKHPILAKNIGIRAAYLECANECMSQILRNSGFLAGLDGLKASPEQRIEHVHQLRVGIRRLRACWKLFGDVANPPEPLAEALKQYFRVLGQARDNDVIQTELLPRLMHAGMPPDTDLPAKRSAGKAASLATLAASPDFQETLLDLLEYLVIYGDELESRGAGKRAAPMLCKQLNAWLDGIRKEVPLFLEAGWDDRHRMRKRVKRLRYGMEFAQGLLDQARLRPLANALVSAQKTLGQLNDLYIAAEYYRGPGAKHPSAMFALGWLAATQEHEARASQLALKQLAKAGRFHPAEGKRRKGG